MLLSFMLCLFIYVLCYLCRTIALVATVICWPYPTLNEFYLILSYLNFKGPSNLTKIVLMIGKEGMVTRDRIRYKRDYLTPGMCSLNKCAVFFLIMPFPAKIHTVVFFLMNRSLYIANMWPHTKKSGMKLHIHPKLLRLNRWSLGIDQQFHLTY